MAFPKLTAMALKQGHTHLSLEFLVEFEAATVEYARLCEQGRIMFAEPEDGGIDKQSSAYEDFHHDG